MENCILAKKLPILSPNTAQITWTNCSEYQNGSEM